MQKYVLFFYFEDKFINTSNAFAFKFFRVKILQLVKKVQFRIAKMYNL